MFRNEKEILTEDEWKSVEKLLPRKFKLIFGFLKASGLRDGAMVKLRVRDVTLTGEGKGSIKVKKAKGGKSRSATID